MSIKHILVLTWKGEKQIATFREINFAIFKTRSTIKIKVFNSDLKYYYLKKIKAAVCLGQSLYNAIVTLVVYQFAVS